MRRSPTIRARRPARRRDAGERHAGVRRAVPGRGAPGGAGPVTAAPGPAASATAPPRRLGPTLAGAVLTADLGLTAPMEVAVGRTLAGMAIFTLALALERHDRNQGRIT
jgi:hypothetical protein